MGPHPISNYTYDFKVYAKIQIELKIQGCKSRRMSKSDSEVISILPHAVAIALFLLEAETYINGHLKKVVHI